VSFALDLQQHSADLLDRKFNDKDDPSEVNIRRSMSASYYALFHQINADAVGLIAPNVSQAVNHRIQRWFDHAEMKNICGRFTKPQLDQPLRGLIGNTAPEGLQMVASSFIQLQEKRHNADYDLSYSVTADEAYQLLALSATAMDAWGRLKGSAEANIFILSLLMWKNWDKER